MESAQLPPCEDTLKQHTRRAKYQAAIWRRSLVTSPETPNHSQEHGWTTSEDGCLVINWMTGSPAPQVARSLLSCKCARACRPNDCTCIVNGLKLHANCKHALTWPVMMTSQIKISRTRQTVKTSERTEMPQVRKCIVVLP